jgi:hypothetical protein
VGYLPVDEVIFPVTGNSQTVPSRLLAARSDSRDHTLTVGPVIGGDLRTQPESVKAERSASLQVGLRLICQSPSASNQRGLATQLSSRRCRRLGLP